MMGLIAFIEQTALGWYFAVLAGLLIFWWRWRRARYEYRATHFELERDLARYKQANALTALVLLFEMGLLIAGIQNVVAPTLRRQQGREIAAAPVSDGTYVPPTRTTQQVSIEPVDGLAPTDPALLVFATPTLTPTPVGTIVPNMPAAIGCDSAAAMLQVPANGMLVHQPITVIGTAFTDNFVFYKLELNGPSTFNSYSVLYEHYFSVTEVSELGQFVPSGLEPGDYRFRLTVFDISNTLRAACEVNIRISPPIPTETPIPSPTLLPEQGSG